MKKIILPLAILTAILALQAGPALAASVDFGNPLSAGDLPTVLTKIMTYLRNIAGSIALIFIILGGIMYMVSAGDKERMEKAKNTLIYAIAGFAIVVASSTFTSEIQNALGGAATSTSGATLSQIALNILRLLLSIVGSLAIISIVVGAIWMFSAAGDKERYELGKKTVIYSIVGVTIVLSAVIILNQIKTLVGG
ncbi:MAG: TrbC/VirB2 family protein [Candidatus Moranbacteria bacterium]|nr:TrbC/VirB2 family protein [Candidatus Moranbacteria bacterium]